MIWILLGSILENGLCRGLFVDSERPEQEEVIMDKGGLSSFLLGLGVGIGIGMLFAPKSGQETRELLKNKAGEGTDFLKQRSSDLKQNAAEWVEKGKEALGRQKESLSDAVEAGKQAYRDAVSQPAQPPADGAAL
jgi:gas vesicle protein